MRKAALVLAVVLSLGSSPALAYEEWHIEARIRRPYCGLVVFHVENYGDRVRYVTLKTGAWERRVRLPAWGGVRIERESKRRASVWFRDSRIVKVEGCA